MSTYKNSEWQLHGFCDASERAYAAAIYVVLQTKKGIRAKLLTAKSKVAPIKVVSLPKLELCGASLLVELIAYVLPRRAKPPSNIYCWSDSQIVLAWLKKHPSKWKPFVANRVSEIVSLLPSAEWQHVRSADNPADLATRGLTPSQLKEASIWWHGPSWLSLPQKDWPIVADPQYEINLEARKSAQTQVFFAQVDEELSIWVTKFSSFDKIVRILAYIYRWKEYSKIKAEERRKAWLTAKELSAGHNYLIKIVQREAFKSDIKDLMNKGMCSNSSKLSRLLPYLDAEGLLRVGGRLHHSFLTEAEKHPLILPIKNHVSSLLIRKMHQITLHGGPTLIQSQLSRLYWLVHGRNYIRKIVRSCVRCARHGAATFEQQMGPLPAVRTRPIRPFTVTGVDYAGPFALRASAGRGQKSFKGYVAIFVCMVVKAVHIEIVSDLTSTAFLAAYRRFTNRRGLCKTMYSDNSTTFQGAEGELRVMFEEISAFSQEIASAVAQDGVQWTYIPPRAPNFGGLWEANVRSFKRHLRRVIQESKLTFEEFYTVATSIEACLNSRPLSPLSSNAQDISALTPGHFLIGDSLKSVPEPFIETNERPTACSRWHLLSLMKNHFWKRWRGEFLSQLQQRAKWLYPNRSFKVGDLVLFKDELTPPSNWPLARIIKLYYGTDGLSRVATIKTATSTFKRSINKLIPLPINEEATNHLVQLIDLHDKTALQ